MSFSGRFEFFSSKQFILRVVSSIFLIAFAFSLAWFGGMPFVIAWLGIGIIVAFEWFRITRSGSLHWIFAGVVYAIFAAAGPILIRTSSEWGFKALMWAFAIIWTTDIMAYLFGRTFGGPKLWPRVSPNKTWSGFIGGVSSGALIGLLLAKCWLGLTVLMPVFLIALLAAVATQAGDLLESAVKRRFNVKDSSNLIPGHGGFMDRLDGCILACAVLASIGLMNGGLTQVAQGILVW